MREQERCYQPPPVVGIQLEGMALVLFELLIGELPNLNGFPTNLDGRPCLWSVAMGNLLGAGS